MARDYALDPDPGAGGAAVAPRGASCPDTGPIRIDHGPAEVICRCAGLRRCDLSRAVAACLAEAPDERPGLPHVRRRLRAPLSCRGCRQMVATAIMDCVAQSGGDPAGRMSPSPASDATSPDRGTERL
jgi:BFD-like [2Fe-2S] binding domain